jgi:4'-phosphopantetheinyl transferase EntD
LLGERATARRREAFALGRAAARLALRDLGVGSLAGLVIGRGPGGEPLWPEGVVGTISHSGDAALAVVGWRSDYRGLGVDLEQRVPGLSERAVRLVCTAGEQAWLACRPAVWRTVVFSAKEAVFKALNPIEGVWLGFADAELSWRGGESVDAGAFAAESVDGGAFVARVRKRAGDGLPAGATVGVRCIVVDREVLCMAHAPATDADGAVVG